MSAEAGAVRRWWKSPRVRNVRRRLSNLQVLLYPPALAVIRLWVWLAQRRITTDRRGPLFDYIRDGTPCIIALWHQDTLPLMFELFRYTPTYPSMFMVSGGRIGTFGEYGLNAWGIECVAGSSAGGGVEAVEELVRRARSNGRSILLMADGSRGPARVARWGAVYLARDTGLPIIGVHAWGDNLVMLKKTWMQLVLPKPWGRAVFLSAEPLSVLPDADKAALEHARQELESRLNAMVAAAEAYFVKGAGQVDAWGPSAGI